MIHSDNTELSEQKPYGSYVSVVLFFCYLPFTLRWFSC